MGHLPRRPVLDFGVEAGKILRQARAEGLSFDDAWNRVVTSIRPSDTSWGRLDLSEPGLVETPLQLTHRVMRDAYESRPG